MRLSSIVGVALAPVAGGIAYAKLVRPRVLNYGATQDEATRQMPGDEILPAASLQTTRAIRIEAPPADVWPWLVHMGPRPRGGAYTYDWIEKLLGLDMRSADHILPEYQRLVAGEFLSLGETGQGLLVREVTAEQSLVFQWKPLESTWSFGLYPTGDGATRLASRNRLSPSGWAARLAMILFMEIGSLIMERKMLQGIKRRAETLAKSKQIAEQACR